MSWIGAGPPRGAGAGAASFGWRRGRAAAGPGGRSGSRLPGSRDPRRLKGGDFDVIAVEDSAMSVFRFPPACRPSSPPTRCCGRAPSTGGPGPPREWPGWAFGELDWRRWPGFQRARLAALRPGPGFQPSRRRGGRRAGPGARRRGFGSTPSAWCCRRRPTPPRGAGDASLRRQLRPPRRTATRRSGWRARSCPPCSSATPDARLRIVGTAPPPEVRALAGPRVEVLADAPERRAPPRAAAVVLAPVRTGGGMRMKVLQAMAAGKAVVTTPRGTEGYTGFGESRRSSSPTTAPEIAAAAVALLADDPRRRAARPPGAGVRRRHHSPEAWAERLTRSTRRPRGGGGRSAWLSRRRSAWSSPPASAASRCGGRCWSLGAQTAPSGSYEVVVAVDGSTDGTVEMLAGLRCAVRAAQGRGPTPRPRGSLQRGDRRGAGRGADRPRR